MEAGSFDQLFASLSFPSLIRLHDTRCQAQTRQQEIDDKISLLTKLIPDPRILLSLGQRIDSSSEPRESGKSQDEAKARVREVLKQK